MNLTRASGLTLLACAGLLASGMVGAQARGPSRWERQRANTAAEVEQNVAVDSGQLVELGAWLQRLVGQYRIDGEVDQAVGISDREVGVTYRSSRRVSGEADCRGIGEGAGIHCVINVEWQPISMRGASSVPAGSERFTLRPAVLLFGIDSAAQGIHVLQVDERSIAIGALGLLSGDTLQLKTTCGLNITQPICERRVRITARPARDLVKIEISIFAATLFTFNLRREHSPQ